MRHPCSRMHVIRAITPALVGALFGSIAFAQDDSNPTSRSVENPPLPIKSLNIKSPTPIRVENASDAGAYIIDTGDTTFDLGGTTLVGAKDDTPADQFVGRAIVVRKAKNVTLKNVNVRGFKVAIYAEDSPGLRLENCDVSLNYRMRLKSTPQREHRDDWLWPHKNDENEWLRYGAGIYLLRCDDAKIINCRARNGQNGICLSKCYGVEISGNDMSFMSGWGLALYRSNKCRVLGNRFDYCVRGYSHGVYNRGQDSAGILVFEQSSDNLFAYNSATHGGDGFFLFGGDETLKVTGKGGCNRNVLYKNDFSYAVMHGIEATFSDQNVFISNTLAHCENGVWAGYSSNCLIEDNQIDFCGSGISIEHGTNNLLRWNRISDCKRGVHLWWDDDPHLMQLAFCAKTRCPCNSESVVRNLFSTCAIGLLAGSATDLRVAGNAFRSCERAIVATADATFAQLQGNAIHEGKLQFTTTQPVTGRHNWLGPGVEQSGPIQLSDSARDGEDAWSHVKVDRTDSAQVPFAWRHASETGIVAARGAPPAPPRNRPREALPGVQSGREFIVIDQWGPYDFTDHRVHPAQLSGWGTLKYTLLTPSDSAAPPAITGDVLVEWRPKYAGAFGPRPTAAGTRTVRPKPDAKGLIPFRVVHTIDDQAHEVSGTLIASAWKVDYFQWNEAIDPMKPNGWATITASTPATTTTADTIDFSWGVAAPAPGLSAERFALVATTSLPLPIGQYRLKTISDDGVRVYFDGKRVIDNWTWHVPTEDSAVVDASGKPEYDIRVEYFEITGHAQLQFFLEPVDVVQNPSRE